MMIVSLQRPYDAITVLCIEHNDLQRQWNITLRPARVCQTIFNDNKQNKDKVHTKLVPYL